MIAIVDYHAGNLTSVRLAFQTLGCATLVTSSPDEIRAADRVVFPGVGAAYAAMENLRTMELVEAVREAAVTKPFLGICLGMQILFEHSEEDGGVDLLGVLPGRVRRFPNVPGCKVPEIGWNEIEANDPRGFVQTYEEYYFVHSYYAELNPCTVATAEYAGVNFTAAVRKGDLFACQFHPEKSGKLGLKLLRNFIHTPLAVGRS
ncbi:MAG: imidazole glycerol phosphate synthase subunit HisH [Kiritimatiellae bacterium]|nr:imidazole glycerol phosphate synthase subunit HisH [Kiritimatiellia bacterium]